MHRALRSLPYALLACLVLTAPTARAQAAEDDFALPDGMLPPPDADPKPAAPAPAAPAPAPAPKIAVPPPAPVVAPPPAPAPKVVAPAPVIAPAPKIVAPLPVVAPVPAAKAPASAPTAVPVTAMALRERPDANVSPSDVAASEQVLANQSFQLAVTLRASPQPDAAVPQLDAAVTHNPRFARAYVARGGLALLGNRLQDAVFDFQRALQVEPTSAIPLYGVGRAYEKAGDRAKACEYYRRFGASNAPDASTKLQEQALAACR